MNFGRGMAMGAGGLWVCEIIDVGWFRSMQWDKAQ